jgi:hypothetical protein
MEMAEAQAETDWNEEATLAVSWIRLGQWLLRTHPRLVLKAASLTI